MLSDVDVLHVRVGHDAVYLSLQDYDIFAITRTAMNSTNHCNICQCDQWKIMQKWSWFIYSSS